MGLNVSLAGNISLSGNYNRSMERFLGVDFEKRSFFGRANVNSSRTFSFGANVRIGDQIRYSTDPLLGDQVSWGVNGRFRPTSSISTNLNLNTTRLTIAGVEYTWTAATSEDDIVDLALICGDLSFAVAYAYVEFTEPHARSVTLGIGTDDDGKMWVNGEDVYTHRGGRGVTLDDDTVAVELVTTFPRASLIERTGWVASSSPLVLSAG